MGTKMSSQSYLKGYGNINIESINREFEKEKETKHKSYQKKKVANSYITRQNKKDLKRKELQRLTDEYRKTRFDYKINNNLTDFQVCQPLPNCIRDLLTVYNTRNIDPLNEITFELTNETMLKIILIIPNKKVRIIINYDLLYMRPLSFITKDKNNNKHAFKIDDDIILISRIDSYLKNISIHSSLFR